MRMILIRHARTSWNKEQRAQGRTDIHLDETGHKQAELLAEALRHFPITTVYSSPLTRAIDTAKPIAAAHSAPLLIREELTEFSFGNWEGLHFDEIYAKYPDQLKESRRRPFSYHIPGAEDPQDVLKRMLSFYESLHHEKDETIAIVTHTIPLKVSLAHFLGLDYDRINSLWLANTGFSEIFVTDSGKAIVRCINDTAHIRGLA